MLPCALQYTLSKFQIVYTDDSQDVHVGLLMAPKNTRFCRAAFPTARTVNHYLARYYCCRILHAECLPCRIWVCLPNNSGWSISLNLGEVLNISPSIMMGNFALRDFSVTGYPAALLEVLKYTT